ncbi:MAG TPA: hypothetical protein ENH80_10655 [Phycisphaerae bacterium]|nr:hypothetical protein [Phycisphaerae bacterium]HDZ44388.1 hypothetical protein [Phycisphaerae bacterium]
MIGEQGITLSEAMDRQYGWVPPGVNECRLGLHVDDIGLERIEQSVDATTGPQAGQHEGAPSNRDIMDRVSREPIGARRQYSLVLPESYCVNSYLLADDCIALVAQTADARLERYSRAQSSRKGPDPNADVAETAGRAWTVSSGGQASLSQQSSVGLFDPIHDSVEAVVPHDVGPAGYALWMKEQLPSARPFIAFGSFNLEAEHFIGTPGSACRKAKGLLLFSKSLLLHSLVSYECEP